MRQESVQDQPGLQEVPWPCFFHRIGWLLEFLSLNAVLGLGQGCDYPLWRIWSSLLYTQDHGNDLCWTGAVYFTYKAIGTGSSTEQGLYIQWPLYDWGSLRYIQGHGLELYQGFPTRMFPSMIHSRDTRFWLGTLGIRPGQFTHGHDLTRYKVMAWHGIRSWPWPI